VDKPVDIVENPCIFLILAQKKILNVLNMPSFFIHNHIQGFIDHMNALLLHEALDIKNQHKILILKIKRKPQ
jgi:hypothetical protein